MNDFKLLLNLFVNEIHLDESDKLDKNFKKRENDLSDFMNDFLLNKSNNLWNENNNLKIPSSIFIQKHIEIMEEYLNYIQLDYFSIPVIGKISSGKTAFLNNLLGLDCFESDIITNKFACIIRHNQELSAPKLFSIILKKRKSKSNQNAYNFIKDVENEIKGNLKNNFYYLNKKITECEDLKKLKKEDFFYILEANLDIFKGRNYIFSKMFEFINLPCLSDITVFYLKNIIPLIIPNTHFSIVLFDISTKEDLFSLKLFKNFFDLMNSKVQNNSVFIINKLDIIKEDKSEENKQILYFKNEILSKYYNIKPKNDHLILLDFIQLKYDKNKGDKFSHYIQSISDKKSANFRILFKKKLRDDFQIYKFPKSNDKTIENKREEDKILLNEINNVLKYKLYDEIDINFLIQMKKIYYENKNSKIKINIKNESNKYDELYNLFNKSFKDTVDDFVGKNNLVHLLKINITLLIKSFELSQNKTEKDYIKAVIYYFTIHWGNLLYPKMMMTKVEGLSCSPLNDGFNEFQNYSIKENPNNNSYNRDIIKNNSEEKFLKFKQDKNSDKEALLYNNDYNEINQEQENTLG